MKQTKLLALSFGVAILTGYVAGCANSAEQCENTGTCKPDVAGGSTSGETGGTASIGGKSGTQKGGTGGVVSASSGGTAGNATTKPCNGKCSGATPVCDTDTNKCVECTKNDECSGATPVCDASKNACVGCLGNTDCTADATKPVCNTALSACVGCLANADCTTAGASRCDTATNTCAACGGDNDCTQIAGKGVCLTGDTTLPNQCVQCTGKKYAACGQLDGTALVCDSLAHTCTTDKKVKSASKCKPCVSDAQCLSGQLCAKQVYGGKLVGHFCFWKQGDTANGAPASCDATLNRPYVNVLADAVSVDNETAALCTLRAVTTCSAINDYSSKSCSNNNVAENQLCGFAPGEDSLCVPFGASQFICTSACTTNLDCDPKYTCNDLTTPKTCTL